MSNSKRELSALETELGIYLNAYKSAIEIANKILGGVNHICVNDFNGSDGAIIWTDHGEGHSVRIIGFLNELVNLKSVKNTLIKDDDKFCLLCAVWFHDVGMFVRHPEFPDLDTQRKYHGKVARNILKHVWDKINWTGIEIDQSKKNELRNKVADICELHQSNTGLKGVIKEKTNLLGGLLLLADALDICKERVSGDAELITNILKDIGSINQNSSSEWWINQCVNSPVDIDIEDGGTKISLKFKINQDYLRQWCLKNDVIWSEQKKMFLNRYINSFLQRYIKYNHFGVLRKRKCNIISNIQKNVEIIICCDSKISKAKDFIAYNDIHYVWVDDLLDGDLIKSENILSEIKERLKAKHIYLFLFDQKNRMIRYLANENLEKRINSDRGLKVLSCLRRQKIPLKWGIIGHVSFCALKEIVPSVKNDPRVFGPKEDKVLELESLIFYPLVVKMELWGVIMANRDQNEFNKRDLIDFDKLIKENKYSNKIVEELRDHTAK